MKPSQPKYAHALLLLVTSLSLQTPAQARMASSATVDNTARLAVVKPVSSCAALSSVELSDIGGQGSRVLAASESTRDGVAVCAVEVNWRRRSISGLSCQPAPGSSATCKSAAVDCVATSTRPCAPLMAAHH